MNTNDDSWVDITDEQPAFGDFVEVWLKNAVIEGVDVGLVWKGNFGIDLAAGRADLIPDRGSVFWRAAT